MKLPGLAIRQNRRYFQCEVKIKLANPKHILFNIIPPHGWWGLKINRRFSILQNNFTSYVIYHPSNISVFEKRIC